MPHYQTAPADVHRRLREKLLVDGFDFVFDPVRSHGTTLVDAVTGREYLDLFSFFASMPVGFNHPGMRDPEFLARLTESALTKPTNSDVYTQAMADFVAAMSRTLPSAVGGGPSPFVHLFFVEGGTLAVENTLKVAFDWKVRKNLARGLPETTGGRVAHFVNAFHGRSGYSLSLTNTFDPRKTQYFPKFDWPRLPCPALRFPITPAVLDETQHAEAASLAALRQAIARHPNDIACLIIEPIQGEGGDNHFRTEFLRELRAICDQEEILLIFDEVQAGFGITGRWWSFEHHGVMPDVFAFGKKAQVCGLAATARVDDVDSVFKVPSRINSTWGGNLVDMVRCTRYIEIIEQERLIANAETVGKMALAGLEALASAFPRIISNPRGKGLMCAFDLPDTATRDRTRKALSAAGVIVLGCGERSIRFRPVLDFSAKDVDTAMTRIREAVSRP